MSQKQWDCSRVADFLTELADLLKRYGLDSADIDADISEHLDNCDSCQNKVDAFRDQFSISP